MHTRWKDDRFNYRLPLLIRMLRSEEAATIEMNDTFSIDAGSVLSAKKKENCYRGWYCWTGQKAVLFKNSYFH